MRQYALAANNIMCKMQAQEMCCSCCAQFYM